MSVYGTRCPVYGCGRPTVSRTRGIPTWDRCDGGHNYLAQTGLPLKVIDEIATPIADYVEGFCFSDCRGIVTLVRKSSTCRIPVLRDKVVGVGGAMEPGETPTAAMTREFGEETGVFIPQAAWDHFVTLTGDGWRVRFFRTFHEDAWLKARTMESKGETVFRHSVKHLDRLPLGPNMAIPMALALQGEGLAFPVELKAA